MNQAKDGRRMPLTASTDTYLSFAELDVHETHGTIAALIRDVLDEYLLTL